MRIIGTCFYHADGKQPNLPNVANKYDVYYKCMAVFFDSARKFHPNEELVIYTDRQIPDQKGIFNRLGVKIEIVKDCKYVENTEVVNNFPGCLFTLDVIKYLTDKFYDSVCLFDSDCIFQSDINRVFEIIENGMICAHDAEYPVDHTTNGQSIRSLAERFNYFEDGFVYYGGEFYGFNKRNCNYLNAWMGLYWASILSNEGTRTYTEEHILSLTLNTTKVHIEPYLIKRHWTDRSYDNTDGTEHLYSVIHLPAEKNKLFLKLFNEL